MATKLPIEGREFVSWAMLREHLRDLDGWIFRGHRDITWAITSSLERVAPPERRAGVEAEVLGEFKRAAGNYLPNLRLPTATIEWLTLMQHHGAPTRLVDWTRSPYVATYFAVEDLDEEGTAGVWALGGSWALERGGLRLGAPRGDFVKQVLAVSGWAYSEMKPFDGIALFQLRENASDRQIIQQAAFTATGFLGSSFEDNLRASAPDDSDLREGLRLYKIPGRWRAEILRDLRQMMSR